MKLSELVECENCGEAGFPTQHGKCPTCGSGAVRWAIGEQAFLLASDFQMEEPQRMSGCDREFLRELGVEA